MAIFLAHAESIAMAVSSNFSANLTQFLGYERVGTTGSALATVVALAQQELSCGHDVFFFVVVSR